MNDVEANKALIKMVYEVGFSNDNIDIMDETFTKGYIARFPDLEPIVGLAPAKKAIGALLHAFPSKYRVEHLIGEGDRVVCRWRAVGIHAGEFHDMTDPSRVYQPTNLPVTFSATDIYRFENGKIAEEWNTLDEWGLLFQIGALVRAD